jgi:hypothetical protein
MKFRTLRELLAPGYRDIGFLRLNDSISLGDSQSGGKPLAACTPALLR